MDYMEADSSEAILSVRNLTVTFRSRTGIARAVRDVSFDLYRGETLAIVGESGSGKTMTAMALLGLLEKSSCEVSGKAKLDGRDLLSMSERDLRRVRGRDLSMVFQDPMTSLDPAMSIGRHLMEALKVHDGDLSRANARARAIELLETVEVPQAASRINQYPHQFSGGMRQRVMIAIAIANSPKVLIADEPTTALDVTIQRQVMQVLDRARQAVRASSILITHDLGLVAENAQRVMVMYAGRTAEIGDVEDVFARPRHPYTIALLRGLPRLDRPRHELRPIPGVPPEPSALPSGCAFHPRCWLSGDRLICRDDDPGLLPVQMDVATAGRDHRAACHFTRELGSDEY